MTATLGEDRYKFMIKSRSILLWMKNISDKIVEKITTRVLCLITFQKSCRLSDNVEKYSRAGQATDDNIIRPMCISGPGSSVGIATGYGLDGSGIKSRWGRDFPHLSIPALGPTQPPVQWVPGLSRGKELPGRDADSSPLLVPWSWKGRALPLLPLWAVRPVQSLSACARVRFNIFYLCALHSG
jgi:hypothetical protein